jgi:cation transport ATPase
MRAAAVVLMDGKLEKLPAVLGLARKTMRIIRQNLFWAFFYNTLGIALAIAGVLNPILAAVAMLLSSASVIGNTTRLMRDEELVYHDSLSYPDQARDRVRSAPLEADAVRLSSSGG